MKLDTWDKEQYMEWLGYEITSNLRWNDNDSDGVSFRTPPALQTLLALHHECLDGSII